MRRREVIAVIGTAAAAWPPAARAQQARQLRRLGVLVTTSQNDLEWGTERTAFLEAMQSLGWTDGTNLRIDYRFAAGDRDRLAASGKELVSLKPDVLLARSTTAVRALLAEHGQRRTGPSTARSRQGEQGFSIGSSRVALTPTGQGLRTRCFDAFLEGGLM